MSADKYPCIFSRQMKAIVYIYHCLLANHNSENAIYHCQFLITADILDIFNTFVGSVFRDKSRHIRLL